MTTREYYQLAWQKLRSHGRAFLEAAFGYNIGAGAKAQYLLEVWAMTGSNGGENLKANKAEIGAVRSWLMREDDYICDDADMYHMAWFYNRMRGYPIPLPESAYDDTRRTQS